MPICSQSYENNIGERWAQYIIFVCKFVRGSPSLLLPPGFLPFIFSD